MVTTKRNITYATLLNKVNRAIDAAYTNQYTRPDIAIVINLNGIYDKYSISESQHIKITQYLHNLHFEDRRNKNEYACKAGYLNIVKNDIGIVEIKTFSDDTAAILDISDRIYDAIQSDRYAKEITLNRKFKNCEDNLYLKSIGCNVYVAGNKTVVYLPEYKPLFAKQGGKTFMYTKIACEKEHKNFINTYDYFKVQQQNIRSSKLVRAVKAIQRELPNTVFKHLEIYIEIDPMLNTKLNSILNQFHMNLSKKYGVDNTYIIHCNSLTTMDDIINLKSATVIHNPDNNINDTWDPWTYNGINTFVKGEKEIMKKEISNVPKAIVKESTAIVIDDEFDLPSAATMKSNTENVINNVRKDVIDNIKKAAAKGKFDVVCARCNVPDFFVEELKSKGYKIDIVKNSISISWN